MALVSKSEAAKLTGKSRTTIHTYVKNGKLSATGGKIETSELIRVFGELSIESGVQPEQPQIVQSERDFTPDQTARIRDLENQLDEVRQDRDSWRDQAQANQRLLEDKSGQDQSNRTDHFMMAALAGGIFILALIIWVTQGQ